MLLLVLLSTVIGHDRLPVFINHEHLLLVFLLLLQLQLLLVYEKLFLLFRAELLQEFLLLSRIHTFESLYQLHRLLL